MTHYCITARVSENALTDDNYDGVSIPQIRKRLAHWRAYLSVPKDHRIISGAEKADRLEEMDKYLSVVDDAVIALAFKGDAKTLEMAALSDQMMMLLRQTRA